MCQRNKKTVKILFTLFLLSLSIASVAQIDTIDLQKIFNYIQTSGFKKIFVDSLNARTERIISMYIHDTLEEKEFRKEQLDHNKVWIDNNCFQSENFCYVNDSERKFKFEYISGQNCRDTIRLRPYFSNNNIVKVGHLVWYGENKPRVKNGGYETIVSFRINQNTITLIDITEIIIN